MKIGDKVKHNITGQTMTVKKLNETVASCVLDLPVPYMQMKKQKFNDIAICLIQNLQLI